METIGRRAGEIEMLMLFNSYDQKSKDLYQSFQLAQIDVPVVVLHDNGFLPAGITSPISFYRAKAGVKNQGKARYFNQIDTPRFWEIRGTMRSGEVFNHEQKVAQINYATVKQNRLVESVDWYDKKGTIRLSEHYNQYGQKWARTVYDAQGKAFSKTWFDDNDREILVQNYFTDDFILTLAGKNYFFKSALEFYTYFIKDAGYNLDRLLINSLGVPFFLSSALPTEGRDILFWQEGVRQELPGNMTSILNDANSRIKQIIVPDQASYTWLCQARPDKQATFKQLPYLYPQNRKNQARKTAFILTNSDQIEKIEALVQALPEIEFNIAALTEMSPKLLAINKYDNVVLYPNANQARLDNLWGYADIYLDINHHDEVKQAVRKAYENNMLIFAFEETVHDRQFIMADNLYATKDAVQLVLKLKKLIAKKATFIQAVKTQNQAMGLATKKDYQDLVNEK